MITKKITEVQNFANGDLGTIIQVQGDEIGQTNVSTLKQDITNSVVSELTQAGGVSLNLVNMKGVVPTYADLPAENELNDAYQVEADGLVYVYTENGFQADGDGFVVQSEPIGVIEEGNTQAVSGDTVFKLGVIIGNDELITANTSNCEVGTITVDGSENQALSSRFRFNDYFDSQGSTVTVYCPTGWLCGIRLYDSNKVQYLDTTWQDSGYSISGADYVRVIFRKIDSSTVTIDEITSDFSINISDTINLVEQNTEDIANIREDIANIRPILFDEELIEASTDNCEVGTITADGSANQDLTNRFRFNDYFNAGGSTVTVYCPAGWLCAIRLYDSNKVQYLDSLWQSSGYSISGADYVRVIFRKSNNATVTVDEINSDFNFVISSSLDNRVDYLEEAVGNINIDNVNLKISKKIGIKEVSHRGCFFFGAPENSIDAYIHSGLCGYKYAETDINFTSDGELVILHDDTLNRTMELADGNPIVGSVNINGITLDDAINNYRLKSSVAKYRRKIPLLEDVLRIMQVYNITPVLELKALDESLDDKFINTFRKYYNDDDVVIISFDFNILNRLKSKTNATRGYLGTSSTAVNSALSNNGLPSVRFSNITEGMLNTVREARSEMQTWTVNTQNDYNRMINLGLRYITTDNCAPRESFSNEYVYQSKLNFPDSTVTNGLINGGVANLSAGGTLLIVTHVNSVQKNSCYINVQSSNGLNLKVQNNGVDIHNVDTTYKITELSFLNNQIGTKSILITNTNSFPIEIYSVDVKSVAYDF